MGLEVSGCPRGEGVMALGQGHGWGVVCVMLCFLISIVGSWACSFRVYSLFYMYMVFYLEVYLRRNGEIRLCSPF